MNCQKISMQYAVLLATLGLALAGAANAQEIGNRPAAAEAGNRTTVALATGGQHHAPATMTPKAVSRSGETAGGRLGGLWHNVRHNLFKPLLLFFFLGFLVTILRVPFEFPDAIYQ